MAVVTDFHPQPFCFKEAMSSNLASRWEAGGSVSMGAAGRDRRVRARPGSKSRQQGRAELDLDEADDADCVRDLAKEEDLAQEALSVHAPTSSQSWTQTRQSTHTGTHTS